MFSFLSYLISLQESAKSKVHKLLLLKKNVGGQKINIVGMEKQAYHRGLVTAKPKPQTWLTSNWSLNLRLIFKESSSNSLEV